MFILVQEIPLLKVVVIMGTMCRNCEHRNNEIKSGTGIEPLGVKIEVTISSREDFSRDLLKVVFLIISTLLPLLIQTLLYLV